MKRINKRIFCTLTLISSTFLPYLTINVKTTTNIPRVKIWTEDSGNLKNGQNGFMFEDNRGNLWSAGNNTPLQKYDYGNSRWETNNDIAGNLSDGDGGFMFQDSKGNLWSAGFGTPLQKYDYDNSRWETDKKLKIKNAGNLKKGRDGFMFEDSRANLWSVGYESPLQKYDYDTRTWDSSSKTSGNLKDGWNGFMFQDKRGNLWSAGYESHLQKYNYITSTWETNWQIYGNILDGHEGFMFEDSRRNLWSIGSGTFLQKFDYGSNIWKTGIKIMRIRSNGIGGFMFEDSRRNLWSSGHGTPLQKYNYTTSTWETSAPISQNLKDVLKNGWSSFMFQDSKGNLWSAGNNTPLQKYDYDNKVWKTNTAIKGNISNGRGGFMFEDSKGYLWSAGRGTPLQVMYSDKDIASVIALIQANTGMTKNATGEILPILTSSNTPFDAAALSSLGIGGIFPTDTKSIDLTYSHEGITSDGDLTITVKITKEKATTSASFTIAVSGIDLAKTKVQKEVDKFKNFNSLDNLNSTAVILPQNNAKDVKTQFEAITGYKAPNLIDGYSISRVIVKTALDTNTKKVVYTVTISDTNSNIATKDIVVTFAVTQDKGLSGGVIAGITIGSILGVGILGFLIYYYFQKLKKQK